MRRTLFLPLIFALGCSGLTPRDIQRSVKGAYDVETRYDVDEFSGMFSGLAGEWSQPDTLIQSEITANVRANYGDTIANGFDTVYGAELLNDIRGYLNSEAPPWVMNLGSSMEGVDRQMELLDVQQAWLIADNETGDLEATQIFNGLAVFEDPDCPGSGAVICDQLEVNSTELLNAEYPVEILSSRYQVNDQGQSVDLESHSVELNYGRLGLFYLTNIILPDDPTTEGVGMRDVVLGAINCRGLAGRIAGDDGTYGVNVGGVDVGLSLDDLVGNCEDGVLGSVNRFVDRFNVPMDMNLSGNGVTSDTNRDGAVDQFTSGTLGGDMRLELLTGQTEEGPVSGLFTGFRVNPDDQ